MRHLRVKNWSKHQHYKERRPPWIKFCAALLDPVEQPEYAALPDTAKLLLHHIWLLASQTENAIPDKWLNADRLNLHSFSRQALAALLASGFVEWFDPASKLSIKTPLSVSLSSVSVSEGVQGDFDSVAAFDAIWREYPRPVGRKQASAHFAATVKTPDDLAACYRALANYKASPEVQRGFVQHGKTWFNNWPDWLEIKPSAPSIDPSLAVGAPPPASNKDKLRELLEPFRDKHGVRPSDLHVQKREDWDTHFRLEFGFEPDEFLDADDAQCAGWLERMGVTV